MGLGGFAAGQAGRRCRWHRAGANAGRLKAAFWQGETCPYLPLPADWETFRKGLKKKLRSNTGYYERALEKQYIVNTASPMQKPLPTIWTLFLICISGGGTNAGFPARLQAVERGNGTKRRPKICFKPECCACTPWPLMGKRRPRCIASKRGGLFVLFGRFEPTLARLSLGTVLTARAIRHAIEADGAAEFDFLRGNEPYKYKWGALDRYNRRVSITHFGLRPALLASGGKIGLSNRRKTKKLDAQKARRQFGITPQ